jgi:hypothetical protein
VITASLVDAQRMLQAISCTEFPGLAFADIQFSHERKSALLNHKSQWHSQLRDQLVVLNYLTLALGAVMIVLLFTNTVVAMTGMDLANLDLRVYNEAGEIYENGGNPYLFVDEEMPSRYSILALEVIAALTEGNQTVIPAYTVFLLACWIAGTYLMIHLKTFRVSNLSQLILIALAVVNPLVSINIGYGSISTLLYLVVMCALWIWENHPVGRFAPLLVGLLMLIPASTKPHWGAFVFIAIFIVDWKFAITSFLALLAAYAALTGLIILKNIDYGLFVVREYFQFLLMGNQATGEVLATPTLQQSTHSWLLILFGSNLFATVASWIIRGLYTALFAYDVYSVWAAETGISQPFRLLKNVLKNGILFRNIYRVLLYFLAWAYLFTWEVILPDRQDLMMFFLAGIVLYAAWREGSVTRLNRWLLIPTLIFYGAYSLLLFFNVFGQFAFGAFYFPEDSFLRKVFFYQLYLPLLPPLTAILVANLIAIDKRKFFQPSSTPN